jgi:hypothetical protein
MTEEKFMARNHYMKFDFEDQDTSFIYRVRAFILKKFNIWDMWDLFPYSWRMYYYDYVKPIFKPQNQRLRKAIPRKYSDISHLIAEVNFEFIKTFYEEEYEADIVDWEATEYHKEFAEWLERAYEYVAKARPQLQKDLEEAYPPHKGFHSLFEQIVDENGKNVFQMVDDGVPYEVKYKDVIRIENEINERDTETLTELIKRREYFWT